MDQHWLPHERRGVEDFLGAAAIGGPTRVAARRKPAGAYRCSEVMAVTDIFDQQARHHSLSLLAGLQG
ncbi:hypothetical protein MBH78_18540 [Oceanimonas sp. NS1]|nr:hypothetical protein [Oceanimonas sp. NS1]